MAITWKQIAYAGVNADITSMTGLDDEGIPITKIADLPETYVGKEIVAKGEGYYLNGVDAKFTVADDDNLSFGNGTTDTPFSFVADIKPDDVAGFNIFNKGVGGTNREYYGRVDVGELVLYLEDDSAGGYCYFQSDETVVSDGENVTVGGSYDGTGIDGAVALYAKGLAVPSSASISNYTAMENEGADLYIGHNGTTQWAKGGLSRFLLFNLNLSATEHLEYSNGAPVPYKYIGASQTNLLTGDDSSFDTAGNWLSFSGGALTIVGAWDGSAGVGIGELTLAVGGGRNGIYISSKLTLGMPYRVSIKAKLLSGTSISLRMGDLNANTTGNTSFTPTATETVFSGEFTSDGTSIMIGVHEDDPDSDGQVILIDDYTLVRIGCVLQLEQSGVTDDTWYDSSGNDLEGTVSGAIAINKDGIATDGTDSYVDGNLTVDGDTDVLGTHTVGDDTNYFEISSTGVATMAGTAKRKLTLRPSLDMAAVGQNEKPTIVTVGAFQGFSLPIWATPAQDDEELFFRMRVPYRWDGVSDIVFRVLACLSGAEDIGDDFNLQLSWEHATTVGAVAATTNDVPVQTEIVAGRVAQYSNYEVSFTIDYDIDGEGNEITAGEILGGRLRRVAVAGTEVDNEIIILDSVVEYQIDKLYGTW